MRDGVRQLLGRVGEIDADAKGGEVDVAGVHDFDAALKVLGHEGGLNGDDGGEIVAFGEEVLVLGEVDGVGCVHGDYFYGGVPAEGGVGVGVGVGVVGWLWIGNCGEGNGCVGVRRLGGEGGEDG